MIELVTLAQVKARLRFDHDTEDADLQGLIYGASAAVMNYLKLDHDAYLNSDGTMDLNSDGSYDEVPQEVQLATILLVGIMSRDRDGVEADKWQHGYLPMPVMSLLYPLRDPALA